MPVRSLLPLALAATLALAVPTSAAVAPAAAPAAPRLESGGRAWFPLGLYTTPSTRARMDELRLAGFDLVRVEPLEPGALRTVLDVLGAAGLRAWVPLGERLRFARADSAARAAALERLVTGVRDHPALALWESVDEPALAGEPPAGLRAGYRRLKRLDPLRPLWTNQAPRGPLAALARYADATDVAGADIYPVPMPQVHSDLPERGLAVVGDETERQLASVGRRKPVLMVLQAFAWRALQRGADAGGTWPSFAESRFMAYDAIVAGAAGLAWYGPDDVPMRLDFWDDLRRVVRELRALAPVLEAPAADPAGAARPAPASSRTRVAERRYDGHRVLLVVNRSARPADARLAVGAGGRWRALFGGRAPRAEGATLALALPAWGVGVLTDHPTFDPRPAGAAASAARARRSTPRAARAAGDALLDGGCEALDPATGLPAAWIVRDPASGGLDPGVRRGGASSLRLESVLAGLAPRALQTHVPLAAGRAYRLSGWVRGTPGTRARLYVEWVKDAEFHSHVTPWFAPGERWEAHRVEFTAAPDPAGDAYVVLQMEGPGRVWFDDLRLAPR